MKTSRSGIALGTALAAMLATIVGAGLDAQTTTDPVTTAVRSVVAQDGRTMAAAADEMPAADYGFKPTPAQRSFGDVVLHVAQSNAFLCSQISGEAAPPRTTLTSASPKADLIKVMQDSFTYCTGAFSKLDDSTLAAEVTIFGNRKVTRAAALIELANDLADHYSQLAMYLRLTGHLPPTAQPRTTSGGRP